jgi:hypothetical protein
VKELSFLRWRAAHGKLGAAEAKAICGKSKLKVAKLVPYCFRWWQDKAAKHVIGANEQAASSVDKEDRNSDRENSSGKSPTQEAPERDVVRLQLRPQCPACPATYRPAVTSRRRTYRDLDFGTRPPPQARGRKRQIERLSTRIAPTEKFVVFAKGNIALAEKFVAFAKRNVALAKKFVAFAKRNVALAEKFVAFAKRNVALADNFVAFANYNVALAANLVAFANCNVALADRFVPFC